jgi:hypothetical protein
MLDPENKRCCPLCLQPLNNAISDSELLAEQEANLMLISMSEPEDEQCFWESILEN